MKKEKTKSFGNIKNVLSDGSTRVKYFGGIVLCVLFAVIGYGVFSNSVSSNNIKGEMPRISDSKTSNITGSAQVTPEYNKLLKKQNASGAAAAVATGDSFMSTIRHEMSASDTVTKVKNNALDSSQPASSQQYQINYQLIQQQLKDKETARQQMIEAKVYAMKIQANLLIAAWQPQVHSSSAIMDLSVHKEQMTKINNMKKLSVVNERESTNKMQKIVLKAGDIVFAKLDTAVNSDEPGPIFATIVSGSLSGAKLIGKIETNQNSKKAALHFNLLSIKDKNTSIVIDAYAVDPDTTRTALGEADNHYLMKGIALFASSFLTGYGDALMKGGQDQQIVSSTNGSIVQSQAYTPQQMALNGLANVGKQAGSSMSSVINRAPTITVPGGIGIGIAFVTDVIDR